MNCLQTHSWPVCRLVRTDISKASSSKGNIEWDNVIPQHREDLMQWATALKVMQDSAAYAAFSAHRRCLLVMRAGAAHLPYLRACRRATWGSSVRYLGAMGAARWSHMS